MSDHDHDEDEDGEHDAHGHHHDHGGGGHGEAPHEPAPPEPRFRPPSPEMVVRGTALAGLAVAAGWGAVSAMRASVLFAPLSAVLGATSVLAGWAAAIHLTGGEKFDDHPFV